MLWIVNYKFTTLNYLARIFTNSQQHKAHSFFLNLVLPGFKTGIADCFQAIINSGKSNDFYVGLMLRANVKYFKMTN